MPIFYDKAKNTHYFVPRLESKWITCLKNCKKVRPKLVCDGYESYGMMINRVNLKKSSKFRIDRDVCLE